MEATVSRKRVEKQERKREITRAALELFAERGFEAASVSGIAQAANVSKGTIYLYFDSKEDLFFSAVAAWIDGMVSQTSGTISPNLRPAERLRALVHAMVELFISDQRSVRIAAAVFQVYLCNPRLLSERNVTGQLFQGARDAVTQVLLDGVSQRAFHPDIARNAEKIAINLLAYLDGIGLHHYMSRDYFDLVEQVDFYLDSLIEHLRSPCAKRGDE